MWAGSRIRFDSPIVVGQPLTRHSKIIGIERKPGGSGAMVFVTVNHIFTANGEVRLTEEHDIVYRMGPAATRAPSLLADRFPDAEPLRTVVPDATLLFRYSALTFNGHRIHYDQPYATTVEGYPGLVVHGPLVATLLLDAWRRRSGADVGAFAFRARRPLFSDEPICLYASATDVGTSLVACNSAGEIALEATLR